MNTNLTQEQIDKYQRDGCIVLEEFLTEDEVMAGVHNGLSAHGAGPNMTPYPKRAMTCAYMPVGARFNGQKNILSDEQVAKLKVGDVLDDEQQNPLV